MTEQQDQSNQTLTLTQLKEMREDFAWVHHKLGTTPLYLEEMVWANRSRQRLDLICRDLQAKIEEIEPPAPKETTDKPKAQVMDLTHIKAVQ